jgi:hypothetical protein
VWRNHLGDADETDIHHNGDGGDVSATDYDLWKAHYGKSSPGAGSGGLAAVPEPGAAILVLFAAAAWSLTRIVRQRQLLNL